MLAGREFSVMFVSATRGFIVCPQIRPSVRDEGMNTNQPPG